MVDSRTYYPGGGYKVDERAALVNRIMQSISSLSVPVCIGLFFIHKHLKARKDKKAASVAAAAQATTSTSATAVAAASVKPAKPKPRRTYKVGKENTAHTDVAGGSTSRAVALQPSAEAAAVEAGAQAGSGHDDEDVEIQPPGNVMEVYGEEQVEMMQAMQKAAAAAGGEGAGMSEYLKALQRWVV